MYGAGDVWGGAIRRDMTEMIYETRTSASRQTENPGRKFFFADVSRGKWFNRRVPFNSGIHSCLLEGSLV